MCHFEFNEVEAFILRRWDEVTELLKERDRFATAFSGRVLDVLQEKIRKASWWAKNAFCGPERDPGKGNLGVWPAIMGGAEAAHAGNVIASVWIEGLCLVNIMEGASFYSLGIWLGETSARDNRDQLRGILGQHIHQSFLETKGGEYLALKSRPGPSAKMRAALVAQDVASFLQVLETEAEEIGKLASATNLMLKVAAEAGLLPGH